MSKDMFDTLRDDEKAEDEQAVTTATPIVTDIARIEKSILDVTIDHMTITTAEERASANEIMGGFKKREKQIKTFEATHIAPKKAAINEIVAEIKPFKNKIASLIKIVQTATKVWDLKIAQDARAEQEKERKRIEAEKAKAVDEMIENKRKDEKTPVETLEKVREPLPVVGSVKVETDRGTSSGKLGKVWFVIKTDGTEWDENTRLPYKEVSGGEVPVGMRFLRVDAVQINEEFRRDEGANFPEWIHIREEIINSRFTE